MYMYVRASTVPIGEFGFHLCFFLTFKRTTYNSSYNKPGTLYLVQRGDVRNLRLRGSSCNYPYLGLIPSSFLSLSVFRHPILPSGMPVKRMKRQFFEVKIWTKKISFT